MTETITVIPGDGIGQEVVPVAVSVLDEVGDFEFEEYDAGDAVAEETGEALPAETRQAVAASDATLFGAAGETAADVILPLSVGGRIRSSTSVQPERIPASTRSDPRRTSSSSGRTPRASTRATRIGFPRISRH